MNQNSRLEIIPFNGKKIYCPVINGEPFVLVNSLIQNIGINYKTAISNIKNGRISKYLAKLSIQKLENSENQYAVRHTGFAKNGPNDQFLSIQYAEWFSLIDSLKGYEYVVLPIRKLPAWLYSIDTSKVKSSVKPVLEKYQDECDDILFDHFFGPIAQRKNVLLEKTILKKRIEELEEELNQDSLYVEYVNLKAEEMRLGKEMKRMDTEVITQQMTIFEMNQL